MKDILDAVNTSGYYKISNFFNQVEISRLRKSLDEVYSKISIGDQIDLPGIITPNSYSTGKSMRIYPSAYGIFPDLKRLCETWIFELSDKFFDGCSQKCMQSFSTYETLSIEEVSSLPRNSYMHVDPYHALKFSTHLTDTDEQSGALQVIPGTCWIGKKIRQENSLDSLLSSDMYTFSKSVYFDNDLEKRAVYVNAKAGDLVILNTDVMHCGGILKTPSLERMTVNMHYRK